jgi:type II secretory pathway component GspD/PulD (secretin)
LGLPLAGLLVTAALAAEYPLTILELKHRLPEALIPQLAPLAGPDGVVTGARDVLLVRAAPGRLADIRRALATLDRPARNLLVEVRSTTNSRRQEHGVRMRVDERIGEHGRVVIRSDGRPHAGQGTGIDMRAGSSARNRRVLQRLRVLDGHSARIRVGSIAAVPAREPGGTRAGTWRRNSVVGVDTGIGFVVTPRVMGGQVVVDIDQRAASWDGAAVRGGDVSTRVSGPLGTWLPLGGTRRADGGQAQGIAGTGRTAAIDLSTLELRVTPAD